MSSGRNYIYGLIGFVVPTVLLILAIPVLVHELGREGFGIYFFAISLTGTIALLDIGIGNAALRFLAADIAEDKKARAGDVVVASLLFYAVLGTIGALIVWKLSPWFAATFGGDTVGRTEALHVFRIAGIQVLPALLVSASISLFKGVQRFDLSTSITSLIAAITYGGVLIAAHLKSISLIDAALISLLANGLALLFSVALGWRVCRATGIHFTRKIPDWSVYRRLFRFGVFMTLNSVSAFFLYHVQRYLIGALLGPASLAAYQIAHAVPAKAHALVNSGAEVLFPRASAEARNRDLRSVYLKVLGISSVLAAAVLLPLWVFGESILGVWIGNELARDVYAILPPMLIGFFVISLSPAPFHVVNGINRPELNTLSWAFCALLNVFLIGIFSINGLTIGDFAWAFAIANVINGLIYQGYVEFIVWRSLSRF